MTDVTQEGAAISEPEETFPDRDSVVLHIMYGQDAARRAANKQTDAKKQARADRRQGV